MLVFFPQLLIPSLGMKRFVAFPQLVFSAIKLVIECRSGNNKKFVELMGRIKHEQRDSLSLLHVLIFS